MIFRDWPWGILSKRVAPGIPSRFVSHISVIECLSHAAQLVGGWEIIRHLHKFAELLNRHGSLGDPIIFHMHCVLGALIICRIAIVVSASPQEHPLGDT